MAKEVAPKKKVKAPTALKRDIQNVKKRLANRNFKSQVRTAIRHFEDAVVKKDQAEIAECLKSVYSMMDSGVKRGVYKINKASRTKSRLAARSMAI